MLETEVSSNLGPFFFLLWKTANAGAEACRSSGEKSKNAVVFLSRLKRSQDQQAGDCLYQVHAMPRRQGCMTPYGVGRVAGWLSEAKVAANTTRECFRKHFD